MSEQEQQVRVETRRIFMRDLSFESPHAVKGLEGKDWKTEINLNVNPQSIGLGDNLFEVRLRSTVTCRNKKKTIYVVEVVQAGIFFIAGLAEEQRKKVLNTFCPNMLFPYIRETVDGLLVKGGFPPLMLAPINFDALYEQSRQEQTNEKDPEEGTKRVMH